MKAPTRDRHFFTSFPGDRIPCITRWDSNLQHKGQRKGNDQIHSSEVNPEFQSPPTA